MPDLFATPTFIHLPELDVPKGMSESLNGVKMGSRIKGSIAFEVVEKAEQGITIAIDHINFKNNNNRKFV